MKAILRVLIKDAAEFVASPRLLVISFVIAPGMLLLVGQLNIRPPQLSVLMSGLANCESLRAGLRPGGEPKGDLGAELSAIRLRRPAGDAVMIASVVRDGAADAAGMQRHDRIVALNDNPVDSLKRFEQTIAATMPGSRIDVTISRIGGEELTKLRVTVAEAPVVLPAGEAIFRDLRELSHVTLSCRTVAERDPFSSLTAQPVDMLINIVDADDERWALYVKETDPRRLNALLELARGIQIARRSATGAGTQTLGLYRMSLMGAVPLQGAVAYYPQAADKSLALLPMTFSLILSLLAFIVAAPSLIREREQHTLEILLSAPAIGGYTVLVGKVLLPVLVALFAALIMLVSMQAVYGLFAKANVVLFVALLVLPILSSALLGLLASAVARSQVQTVMAAAMYFFCLLLLSGFLYPAEVSTAAVRTVTMLFGLTYLLGPANAWFFGANPLASLHIVPLLLQCLGYAALVAMAWRRQLRLI